MNTLSPQVIIGVDSLKYLPTQAELEDRRIFGREVGDLTTQIKQRFLPQLRELYKAVGEEECELEEHLDAYRILPAGFDLPAARAYAEFWTDTVGAAIQNSIAGKGIEVVAGDGDSVFAIQPQGNQDPDQQHHLWVTDTESIDVYSLFYPLNGVGEAARASFLDYRRNLRGGGRGAENILLEETVRAIFRDQHLANLFDAAARESETNSEHGTDSLEALGKYLAEIEARTIPALAAALAETPLMVASELDDSRFVIATQPTGGTGTEIPAYSHEGGEPLAPAVIAGYWVSALNLD